MIKYFQMNRDSGKELCPLYGNCETGRVLPLEFCTRYKCNTYHQIDTIELFLDSQFNTAKVKKDSQEVKPSVVEQMVENNGVMGNNNGFNGNGRLKLSPISASFI